MAEGWPGKHTLQAEEMDTPHNVQTQCLIVVLYNELFVHHGHTDNPADGICALHKRLQRQKYCEYVNTCWWTGDWKRSLCLFYKRTLINTACFENGQQNQKHLPRIWKHRTVSPGNSPPSLCRQPQTQTGCRSVPTVEEKRCAKERQLADQSTSRRCVYRCVQYAPWQTLAVLTSLQHWAETQFEIANNRIEN